MGEESPFAIFQKVHRLLRGRYHWAIALGLLGATLGAVGGYVAMRPLYQSVGSIHIAPRLPRVLVQTEINQIDPMFSSHVRTRANLLQDQRVLDAAMASEAWRSLGRGITPAERDSFRKSLRVSVEQQDPEWIWIRFSDPDPEAARIAVDEIINAYVERHGALDNLVTPEILARLQQLRNERERSIRSLQNEINRIGSEYATNDLRQVHEDAMTRFRHLDLEVSQLEWDIAEARQRLAHAEEREPGLADEPRPRIRIAEIANRDQTMRSLVVQRMTLNADLEARRSRGLGPDHRNVRQLQSQIDAVEHQIDSYAEEWLAQNAGQIPGARIGATVTPEALAAMEAQLLAVRPLRDQAHQRAREINAQSLEVQRLQADLSRERERLASVEDRLNALNTEHHRPDATGSSPRMSIVSRGDVGNSPAVDNRRKLAALGLIFGGGLPIGLILLLGLMDRRYRFAEDADGSGKTALLGVLPYLPGGLNDPEQAGIAAHCVHQIRTLLQISAANHSRKVFAVTSPTAGDGKTSLSLSLGLSFAASGSRTCLIDFDMIGAGLTAAMQVKTDLGLLDAIEGGHLNGHIRSTSFTRLSLLPVGEHDAQEVSRLSPAAVRRLLDQARDEFDVVIVDTGPVLGSIEASLVCAEADGVVMTVGRGQQRPVAERALSHLNIIGARLLGIVFNRADANDFRRTMMSTSIRSMPLQNGSPRRAQRHLPALGPMASSVARDADGGPDDDR